MITKQITYSIFNIYSALVDDLTLSTETYIAITNQDLKQALLEIVYLAG